MNSTSEKTRIQVEETPETSVKTEETEEVSETSSQQDSLSSFSKKINKKRKKKYSKIDDTIRMKLLEDVENGDTLKAAATRYGVNYSSAKSIFHTYRKEGRILKKPARERYRRKLILPTTSRAEPLTIIPQQPATVAAPSSNQNLSLNSLLAASPQLLSQLQQLQALSALVKTAQQANVVNQLQSIQSLLNRVNVPQAPSLAQLLPQMINPQPMTSNLTMNDKIPMLLNNNIIQQLLLGKQNHAKVENL